MSRRAKLTSLLFVFLMGCQGQMLTTDFNALVLPTSPNFAFVAPQGFQPAPTIVSPEFKLSQQALAQLVTDVVKRQPRVTPMSQANETYEYHYIQRTALFRFPDQIDIRVIAVGPNQSSLLMLSRSLYGYSDFGHNHKRMTKWLSEIEQAVQSR